MKTWLRHRNALLAASVLVAAGALGFAVVLRTAFYYADTDPVAHALVWLIGLGMAGGLWELGLRLSRAVRLSNELAALPEAPTEQTLSGLRPELRAFLQARLERAPLPAAPAAFTPYLVGLLVMLGLLGTFLGLFDTLRGARDALTASGDIEALRAGLAHPMAGLTRSFGSSAAGVSCSAMLGLALVCVRRVEMAGVMQAQAYASGPLQHLSPYRQQHDALLALAEQGTALPAAAQTLASVGERLDALAHDWQKAHAESSREMREALQGAVQDVRSDMERAAQQSADRLHQHVAPLLDGVVERASRAAEARFDALQKTLTEHSEARREAEQALRDEARVGLTELLGSARTQLQEQREQQRVQLDEQREQQSGQLAIMRESAEGFAETLREQTTALVQALSESHAQDTAQVERAQRALSELERAATAVGEHLAAQKAQVEALVEQTGGQVTALTESAQKDVAETLQALHTASSELTESFAAQVARLEQTQLEGQRALAEELSRHAAQGGEGLSQAGGTVSEAAALLQSTSAELSAVAEMFAASVESQREAAKAWLENLGELEGAIEQSGREAAADALGEQLAATQEVFARQLQFQKELFEQLRDLRPGGGAHGEQRASA